MKRLLRIPEGALLVILLDEPLANIDRETTGSLETVIASLPARGTPVVLITHDPDQSERFNGESIPLEGGKVAIPRPPARWKPTFEIRPDLV